MSHRQTDGAVDREDHGISARRAGTSTDKAAISYRGESGRRHELRRPGYFGVETSVGKWQSANRKL